MNFNSKDRNRIELDRNAKVQQKKKNGKWFNTITTSLRFLRIQREEEADQNSKRKFTGKLANLARGTIAAGFAVGGAAAANGMSVHANEVDPAQQELQQENTSGSTEVEVIVEETTTETTTPAESSAAETAAQAETTQTQTDTSQTDSSQSETSPQTDRGLRALLIRRRQTPYRQKLRRMSRARRPLTRRTARRSTLRRQTAQR